MFEVKQVKGGYIVTDRYQHVGRDNYWARKAENATPFKAASEAARVAESLNRR